MKTSYYGNPWIGMFIKTNDSLSILPVDSMKKLDDVVAASLKTEVIKVGMSDSNLLGVYVAMNSNGIVLPNIVRENEMAVLKDSGLNIHVSGSKNNALGNNIAVNDKRGIINPNIDPADAKGIADALGVELVPMSIAGFTTVGSACLATNNGFLAHFKTTEDEMAQLRDAFKVPGNKGTMNTGTGFVSYGAVVNKNGYVVGEDTTAYEIGRLEEALGLIR